MVGLTKIVVSDRPWSGLAFRTHLVPRQDNWMFASTLPSQDALDREQPHYLFFPHWSAYVPRAIVERYECVGFHESPLPEGRGGSPIQHEILAGKTETLLTAFRMTDQMDAGPVYLQRVVSLAGRAEEIYHRIAMEAAVMMIAIDKYQIQPRPQVGPVTVRERRRPAESEISEAIDTDNRLYDFLRMLDCPGYPAAFLIHGRYRYEFTQVQQADGAITAQVRITPSVAHV